MTLKWKKLIVPAAMATMVLTATVTASDLNNEMMTAYDTAIKNKDFQEGFHALVNESTTSAKTGVKSDKTVEITANGFDEEGKELKIIIKTAADNEETTDYYADGYYYTTIAGNKVMYPMDLSTIGSLVNMDIYHSLAADHLSMLYSTQNEEGKTEFNYAATDESLGSYKTTLLDAMTAREGSNINFLQGKMIVNANGHVEKRMVDLNYSLTGEDGTTETFHKIADAAFDQIGNDVKVELPDLSEYEGQVDIPDITINPVNRKIWTITNVNIRSAGSVDGSVIGGASTGMAFNETGTTADGWSRIEYNGRTAYIKSDYVTENEDIALQKLQAEKEAKEKAEKEAKKEAEKAKKKAEKEEAKAKKAQEKAKKAEAKAKKAEAKAKKAQEKAKKQAKKEKKKDQKTSETTKVKGKITSISKSKITIRTNDGGTLTLKKNKSTTIDADRKLKKGDKISAKYKYNADKNTFVAVEIKLI